MPVFFASAPFRLVSFSSLVAAPRWKLCLYCFLLRLQGNGQKDRVIILPVCSENWQKHSSLVGLIKGKCLAGLLWCISQVAHVHSMSSAWLGTSTASLQREMACCACIHVTACQCLQPHQAHPSWFASFHSWTQHAALLTRRHLHDTCTFCTWKARPPDPTLKMACSSLL